MERPPAQSERLAPRERDQARPPKYKMKRAGPRIKPRGTHVRPGASGPEYHGRGSPLFCPKEKTGPSEQSKAEDIEPEAYEREPSARPN